MSSGGFPSLDGEKPRGSSVFRDYRVDQIVSWVLVLLVAVTGWFVRDVIVDLRNSQRATEQRLYELLNAHAAFRVDIAELQAQISSVREMRDAVARTAKTADEMHLKFVDLTNRISDLERDARRGR